jgi:hypothetical protein
MPFAALDDHRRTETPNNWSVEVELDVVHDKADGTQFGGD